MTFDTSARNFKPCM